MGKKVYWPSWRYSPEGEARIFDRPEDVPPTWFASKADAEAYAAAQVTPPENGTEYWEGYSKEFLTKLLRHHGHRVHANSSVRKLYDKCDELGILDDESEGENDAVEEGLVKEGDFE
jgi:hypothetical protein